MNPETNKFEHLEFETDSENEALGKMLEGAYGELFRPNGKRVPKHWSVFSVGKNYEINGYTFKCAYIGETSILFEPVGPVVIGQDSLSPHK
jgi:hypothetical protein